MSRQEIAPDYGLYLLNKYGENVEHFFMAVPIFYLAHVGHNQFTFTVRTTIDAQEYTASFDFDTTHLQELINHISDDEFAEGLNKKLKCEFTRPLKMEIQGDPIYVDITAQLGNPVKSLYETFVPFIVNQFSNLKI